MVEKGQNYPANRRYCSAQVRTQTQLHSLFPYSDNPMGQLSDTTAENQAQDRRLYITTGVKNTTSILQAVIKHF